MIDERSRKNLILEHSRRLNAADVDGLLELYADDVTFEDPIGSGQRSGRDALRKHFEELAAAGITEVPGEPVAGQDGVHVLVPVTATLGHLPKGPGFADRGWPTAPDPPEDTRLTWDYVLMVRVGAGGLIQELRKFWGRSDMASRNGGTAQKAPIADEATLKTMALEYARRMNAGDVDDVLALFSDDIVFEDPVGAPPLIGKEALREHIAWSIACRVHETPGRPVASMDGRWAAVPTTVAVYAPTKLTFSIVGVIELGDDGLVHHAQAFWGITDTKVGDGPELTGVAHFMAVTQNLARMVQAKGSPSPM